MNAVKTVLGFVPLVGFSLLSPVVGAGWAAVIGVAVALTVVSIGIGARDGIMIMPTAQATILLAMAALAFTGGPSTDAALVKYGAALLGVLLGLFILATASTMPFTAQDARATVSPEVARSRRFLEVNQHISTAWGLAILLVGVCHIAGAEIAGGVGHLALRMAVNWVLPVVALVWAARRTKHLVAAARQEAQQAHERYSHQAEQAQA